MRRRIRDRATQREIVPRWSNRSSKAEATTLRLYGFVVPVRDNLDYNFGKANAKHGEVLEVRHLNPFIIDISPIHRIEIVKPNAVLSDCHCAVQRTYFGVINLHVCPAAYLANACSRFRQSVRRAYRPPLTDADHDGGVKSLQFARVRMLRCF